MKGLLDLVILVLQRSSEQLLQLWQAGDDPLIWSGVQEHLQDLNGVDDSCRPDLRLLFRLLIAAENLLGDLREHGVHVEIIP